MARPVFRTEECKGCELCLEACPKHILAMAAGFNGKGYHHSLCRDEGQCIGCALCARACPDVVIDVYK